MNITTIPITTAPSSVAGQTIVYRDGAGFAGYVRTILGGFLAVEVLADRSERTKRTATERQALACFKYGF